MWQYCCSFTVEVALCLQEGQIRWLGVFWNNYHSSSQMFVYIRTPRELVKHVLWSLGCWRKRAWGFARLSAGGIEEEGPGVLPAPDIHRVGLCWRAGTLPRTIALHRWLQLQFRARAHGHVTWPALRRESGLVAVSCEADNTYLEREGHIVTNPVSS